MGGQTSVRVNGNTVLSGIPQQRLPGGYIGVVAHWSLARFDAIQWQEFTPSRAVAPTFADNFNGGAATRWRFVGGQWSVQNRVLVGAGVADLCHVGISSNEALIQDLQASDVDITVNARSLQGIDKALVLRSSSPGNQIELRLVGGADNAVFVRELRDCELTLNQVLFFPERWNANVTQQFRAWLLGNYVRVWLNERLVAEFELPFTLERGAVGLGVVDGERA
ncbi:MAG: hypothetical protein ABW110_12215, partial [Steroidobacteraceae bacterium]